jgi:hypothetical protein
MRFRLPGKAAAKPAHSYSIKLKLRDISQLFNSMDPSPFIEKDLDSDAERLMKQGRTSLFIGSVFLAGCLIIISTLLSGKAGTWAIMLHESLTIAGWVAMWRPMQIYLYDWWPLRQRSRIYTKLSHMPVEVIQQEKG